MTTRLVGSALGILLAAGCKAPQSASLKDVEGEPAAPQQAAAPVDPDSEVADLTGDHLGFISYTDGKPRKRAVRLYFKKLESNPNAYNVVIFEYPELLKIAPQFVTTPQPGDTGLKEMFKKRLHKLVGDLKKIGQRITVYRATPRADAPGQFVLQQLLVGPDFKSLVVNEQGTPSILMLDRFEMANAKNPMAGARITVSAVGEPGEVVVPKTSFQETGFEYRMATTVYAIAGLKSTWRSEYLTGKYLATYGKENDIVMQLSEQNGAKFAEFLDPNPNNVPIETRKQQFTNPKSAEIQGKFSVVEPVDGDGIFLFAPLGDVKGAEFVQTKMGLFVDVFDATESLGLDVVEIAHAEAAGPTDFLMYYEDPRNGEGRTKEKAAP